MRIAHRSPIKTQQITRHIQKLTSHAYDLKLFPSGFLFCGFCGCNFKAFHFFPCIAINRRISHRSLFKYTQHNRCRCVNEQKKNQFPNSIHHCRLQDTDRWNCHDSTELFKHFSTSQCTQQNDFLKR